MVHFVIFYMDLTRLVTEFQHFTSIQVQVRTALGEFQHF